MKRDEKAEITESSVREGDERVKGEMRGKGER